jgi:hypothetical protein
VNVDGISGEKNHNLKIIEDKHINECGRKLDDGVHVKMNI